MVKISTIGQSHTDFIHRCHWWHTNIERSMLYFFWETLQYLIRRLLVRSREVSKSRDWPFKSWHRCEIWQTPRQPCCQGAFQISERSDNSKFKSRGFKDSRDLTIRLFIGYWNGAVFIWLRLKQNACHFVQNIFNCFKRFVQEGPNSSKLNDFSCQCCR